MTDNEIIKALECCIIGDCFGCYYGETNQRNCKDCLMENALALINRQKAEIERLKELLEGWKKAAYKAADEKDEIYCNAIDRVKTAKAEAIKEFAERLKERATHDGAFGYVDSYDIDHITKEMVGDNNG